MPVIWPVINYLFNWITRVESIPPLSNADRFHSHATRAATDMQASDALHKWALNQRNFICESFAIDNVSILISIPSVCWHTIRLLMIWYEHELDSSCAGLSWAHRRITYNIALKCVIYNKLLLYMPADLCICRCIIECCVTETKFVIGLVSMMYLHV